MPQVSVIVTAFNAERFIETCVRSVLDQSYADLECIVVDDGSTDRTLSILEKIQDPRLRLLTPGRIGRGRALNAGWQSSRGQFIAIQDADDFSHLDRLAVQVGLMNSRPEIAVLGSGHRRHQIDEGTEGLPAEPSLCGEGNVKEVSRRLPFINPLSHTSLVVRREALEKVGGYDVSRRNLFDWDLLIRLHAAKYEIYKYSVPLVTKTIHQDQFFEAKRHWRYVWSSFRLQFKAVYRLHLNPLIFFVFAAQLGYRILPRRLRLSAKALIRS